MLKYILKWCKGWTGTNCTDDINECDVRPDICDGKPNSTCKNNIGSYICECDDGYQEINGTCEGNKYIFYTITETCFCLFVICKSDLFKMNEFLVQK